MKRQLVIALEISCVEVTDDVYDWSHSEVVCHPKEEDHLHVIELVEAYYEDYPSFAISKGQWTKPFKSDNSMFNDLFYMTTTATFNTESPKEWHSVVHAVVAEVALGKEWEYGENKEADKFLAKHLEAAKTFYKRSEK